MSASEPERDGWYVSDSIDTYRPTVHASGALSPAAAAHRLLRTGHAKYERVLHELLQTERSYYRHLNSAIEVPSRASILPSIDPDTDTDTTRAACALRRAKRHRPAVLSDPVCVAAHVRDHGTRAGRLAHARRRICTDLPGRTNECG